MRERARHNVPDRNELLTLLRADRRVLQQSGIRRAALFGSTARGDANADSDVDVLVVLDPDARIGLVRFIDLQEHLRGLFGREVDLISRGALRLDSDVEILTEAVWAF
jgi:predicted nucleotidyltransferase